MSEQTESTIRSRIRRVRRHQRKLDRRDDDGSDSEDESSSSVAAASTSNAASASSSPTLTTSPLGQSAIPTSVTSIESISAAPTALPIVESSTPFFTTVPASSSEASEFATTTSSPTDLSAASSLGVPALPAASSAASSPSGIETRIAIGAGVTSGLILLLGLLACLCLRRWHKRRMQQIDRQGTMSESDSEIYLVRGGLGPSGTIPWRPWSTRPPPEPRRSPSFLANGDQDMFVANGMRPRSIASQSSNGGGRGWYSVFSGSERIISALTFSSAQRRSSPTLASSEVGNGTSSRVASGMRENRVDSNVSAFLADSRARVQSAQRSHGSRFIESRFSDTERTNSSAPTSETVSMFFNRDSVARPERALHRTSSALEREYVTIPAGAAARASTASSHGSMSLNSILQAPPVPEVPWKYSVGSLRSWLVEQRRSKQNVTRLP